MLCLLVRFVCSLIWLSSCPKYHNYGLEEKAFNWSYDIDYFEWTKLQNRNDEETPEMKKCMPHAYKYLEAHMILDYILKKDLDHISSIFCRKKKSLFAGSPIFSMENFQLQHLKSICECLSALFLVICFSHAAFNLLKKYNILIWKTKRIDKKQENKMLRIKQTLPQHGKHDVFFWGQTSTNAFFVWNLQMNLNPSGVVRKTDLLIISLNGCGRCFWIKT